MKKELELPKYSKRSNAANTDPNAMHCSRHPYKSKAADANANANATGRPQTQANATTVDKRTGKRKRAQTQTQNAANAAFARS